MNNKNKFSVQMLAEAGLTLALSFILSNIKLGQLPQGGSITLASMFPLILFSIRWSACNGVIVGALFGIITLLFGSYPPIHPAQLILDYPLAYGFIGLSGISVSKDKKDIYGYLPFVVISHLLRMASHVASGVIFFAEYAPEGMSPFKYSLVYNASYMVPELIISIVFLFLLWKPLIRLVEKQN